MGWGCSNGIVGAGGDFCYEQCSTCPGNDIPVNFAFWDSFLPEMGAWNNFHCNLSFHVSQLGPPGVTENGKFC